MSDHKKYNFNVNDVSEVYAGPGGQLWELLMGEQIHVGGEEQTDYLINKIGLKSLGNHVKLLDICSALGGPARYLAENYGVKVIGVDITIEMINEAIKRTEDKSYSHLIEYRLGSALDIPAHNDSFDVVWGQDAWCYITDKKRLIEETFRVCKSGGFLAFTDWIWGSVALTEEEADFLMEFMVFPSMETLKGYINLIEGIGYKMIEFEDFQDYFAKNMDIYLGTLQKNKNNILEGFGVELYQQAEKGILAWQKAAHEKKVNRGLWIAKKA